MVKKFMVVLVTALAAAGYLVFSGAPDHGIPAAGAAGKEKVIEAKEVTPAKEPAFNAIAYIAGHGGHVAIIDMRTMKPPTDIEKDRIVFAEAGSEMEGKIAGMNFEEVKKAGGTHGQALINEKGRKVMIVGTLAIGRKCL